MAEYTSSIKSSGTQFYKADLASEMLSKSASGYGRIKLLVVIVLAGHGAPMEFLSQNVFVLWIQHRGTDREYNFQGKMIAPTSHLAQLRKAYNFSSA